MKEVGVGIIGSGVRGVYCLGKAIAMLHQETGLAVTGVCDTIRQRSVEAKSYLERLYQDRGVQRDIRIYDDYQQMIGDDACRIIVIASFTRAHKTHAVAALGSGKVVYLDKPIAVTLTDASQIVEAAQDNPVLMGFTRRYEKSWIKVKELLDSGTIGPLQMMEINSIVPYSRYLQTWHRRRELSGGSINDKSSHHFDVFNWMAGERPQYLTAVGGRSSVFPVDENAPKSCAVCTRQCEYRRDPNRRSDGGFVLNFESWKNAVDETARIDNCVYAEGANINDHALVSIVYPSGTKASLFFCIFGPDTTDQESLLLVGERGKIILNRHESQITVYSDFGRKREEFDCRGAEFDTSHFGADRELIRALRAFHDGEKPVATAEDGYMSLQMALAAQESIQHGGQPISFCRGGEVAV